MQPRGLVSRQPAARWPDPFSPEHSLENSIAFFCPKERRIATRDGRDLHMNLAAKVGGAAPRRVTTRFAPVLRRFQFKAQQYGWLPSRPLSQLADPHTVRLFFSSTPATTAAATAATAAICTHLHRANFRRGKSKASFATMASATSFFEFSPKDSTFWCFVLSFLL